MISKSATKQLFMLVLCASAFYCGCSLKQNREPQNIPSYVNSFQYCRSTAYAPDVMELVPECKADPPGRKIYQLTTTVWNYRASASRSAPDGQLH
jgi:hypothetical protein